MIDWGEKQYILDCIEHFVPRTATQCCPISEDHDVRRYCFGEHAIEARRAKRQPLLDGSTRWDGPIFVVHGHMRGHVFMKGNSIAIRVFEDVECNVRQVLAFLQASCVQTEWGVMERLVALL